MRDKRRRGPGSQGPDDANAAGEWLDARMQPWASATPANDNGRRDDLARAAEPANDFGDEATTLYHKEMRPPSSAPKTPRRPSARYRPTKPTRAADEPGFGIEGSLPRSLRPGQAHSGRNYGVLISGLLAIGLGALWIARGPAWSRAMLSISPHSASVTHSHSLGQGHVVVPAPEPAPQPSPAESEPAQLAAPIMEFELADVPSDEPSTETPDNQRSKRSRARHAQRSAARAHRRSKAPSRPIQPLVEQEEDYQEPVYYRAAVNEGTLQVNSRPWARVLVDGRFMGHTPQRALRLPVGRHRVQLVNEQLDMSKLFDVVITPGEVVTRVEILDENRHTSR